jgi:LDH2 family malate/lactate/ureidoglycolate dehydrogenase
MEVVRAAATVAWQPLVDFGTDAYMATGVPAADARKASEALVDADLHGTVTHVL